METAILIAAIVAMLVFANIIGKYIIKSNNVERSQQRRILSICQIVGSALAAVLMPGTLVSVVGQHHPIPHWFVWLGSTITFLTQLWWATPIVLADGWPTCARIAGWIPKRRRRRPTYQYAYDEIMEV